MDKLFEGKVALVTGGSFGIGQATAIAFAGRGAKVIVADYLEDKNQETIKQIKKIGGEAIFIQCDVSNHTEVKNMINQAITHYKRLDFAFNNAGIEGKMGNMDECTEDNWDKILNVNLKGVWLCMKYEIPQMLKQNKGVIINCASVAGLNGFADFPAYTASKHGVVGLSKSAALEYALKGIRINTVCPGVIHTPMIDRLTGKDPAKEKQYADMEPIGRMGKTEEVAAATVWLCSDAASFVTGIALPVDGGLMAG